MGFGKAIVVLQLSLLFVGTFTAEADQLISALPPHAPAHPPHPHHHHHPPAEAPSHHHGHHGHPPAHPPSYSPHPPPKPLPPKPAPPVHPPKPKPPVHPAPPLHPPKPAPPVHPPPKPEPPVHPAPPLHPPKPAPPVHPPPKPEPPVHPAPPLHPPKPLPPKPAPGPAHPPMHQPPFPRTLVAVQGVVYCKSCKYPGVDTLYGASPILGATVKLQCNNTKYPQEVSAKTDKNGYFFLEAPKTITNYGVHKCKAFLGQSPMPKCSKPSALHGGVSGAELRPVKSYIGGNKLPFVLFTVGPLAYEPQCH